MKPHEFDKFEIFSLSSKRATACSEIFDMLVQCLPRDFLSKTPDDSLLDALSYELLRMYVASQSNWVFDPNGFKTGDPTDLVEHLLNPPKLTVDKEKSVPKAIRTAFKDENFKFFVELSMSPNFSREFLSDLQKIKSLSDIGVIRFRREIHSKNINGDPKKAESIPFWVKPAKVSSVLFFYRWCLLLAHSHGFYRSQSLKIYDEVKRRFSEKLHSMSKGVMTQRYKNFYNAMLFVGQDQVDQPRSIEKRISEMSLSWAITFMHSDYVGLIKWRNLGDIRGKTFLSEFVCNNLGGHILEVKIGNKWTAGDQDWEKFLRNKGKIVPTLKSIKGSKKCDQVFEFRKENHCFSYLLDYDPMYRRGILNQHDIDILGK